MNIRTLLHKLGYDVYEGPIGMIDYDLVSYGHKLAQAVGLPSVEVSITFADSITFYTFYKEGFSIQRWVKKSK